ncbi:DNA polymerase alpha subunit B isoform X1 [Patella vulgata]|uniref:DNA polymerase alpha subunit B isoform X1 n=1 Tax=Patella vulgata TaxID=6465 RepID=UPI00217FDA1B|nr:DNA polymerase alpha subunit B isoform X1 [Patella vulgata]
MSNITDDELMEEFETFGIELEEDGNVSNRLKELCALYRMTATDIVNEWIAFSQTKKGTQLIAENLEAFDREKLSKRLSKTPKTPQLKKQKPTVYNINTIHKSLNDDDEAQKLYNAYGTPKAKGNTAKKRQHTPDSGSVKRLTGVDRIPAVPFSPASFSPTSTTPSRKYTDHKNSGEVLVSFPVDNVPWQRSEQECIVGLYNESQSITANFRYMFQKLTDKAHVLNDMIEDMASQLQQYNKIEELSHAALPTQEIVNICGRICCDSIGKLNNKSVLLEGSRDTSAGKCIPVDLTSLSEYSLFPGQIIALEGLNSSGQKFVAQKKLQNVRLPLPVAEVEGGQHINIVVAAGPFTTSHTLAYEPLADLLKLLQNDQPNVLIILGPIVDARNTEIEKGNVNFTYEELFKKQIDDISDVTERINCEVIIIPSYRDIHHDSVYPQPPYIVDQLKSHVHLMSDPCTLTINNIVFGVTSSDILFHIGQEEISFIPGSRDRLARLAKHLLLQQSFYPLYPPVKGINIDYDQLETFGKMLVTPHILLVPSDLKYFIKDIDGCCVVNPGRLAKGQIGGTYSRMVIKTDSAVSGSIIKSISAQVVRI